MHCPLKHCITRYWQCTWRWGTGGVHRGGPCPFKHCVTGYLVSPVDAEDVPQAAYVERNWVSVFADRLVEFWGLSLSDMVSF